MTGDLVREEVVVGLVEREIAFIQVPRAALETFGGAPWSDVTTRAQAGEDGVLYFRMGLGYTAAERDDPRWTPPVSIDPKTLVETPLRYLPLGSAWLREVDGRAFLYLQNW